MVLIAFNLTNRTVAFNLSSDVLKNAPPESTDGAFNIQLVTLIRADL